MTQRTSPLLSPVRPSDAENPKSTTVRQLLARLYPKDRIWNEQRSEARYPFPYFIRVLPVASDGVTPLQKSFTVVGKHISEHGLGFYHTAPMPYRFVVATINEDRDEPPIHMLVDLTWCRFSKKGWYENGGSLIRQIDDPAWTATYDLAGD